MHTDSDIGNNININNLTILKDYLDNLPKNYDHFNMRNYAEYQTLYGQKIELVAQKMEHTCGTSACAIGHGPLAGLEPKEKEDWTAYGERITGLNSETPTWDYLFGDGYANRKEGLAGAIQRLEDVIEGFRPSEEFMDDRNNIEYS